MDSASGSIAPLFLGALDFRDVLMFVKNILRGIVIL